MSIQTAGRGAGRFQGRGRGYIPQNAYKGAIPTIGAYLNSGKGFSANDTAIWASKLKDYAMSHFETNIDDIFGANGGIGEYPSKDDPETPDDENDRVAFKIWDVAYSSKCRFEEKLAIEKTQLFGIMLGQISESSKDLIKETDIGRESFVDKDPLALLRGIVQTRMCDSRLGSDQNLHKSQLVYNNLTMQTSENVSLFFQKIKTSLSALEEAHLRCGNEPAQKMDDEAQQVIKFIHCLSTDYNEFRNFFLNRLLPYPTTLDEAFSEASSFRVRRNEQRQHRADIFATATSTRGGRSG